MNVWTDPEKEIFKEKFLLHSKNFGQIAQFLERKSVSDCVQYYYLSKKTENYKQLMKRLKVSSNNSDCSSTSRLPDGSQSDKPNTTFLFFLQVRKTRKNANAGQSAVDVSSAISGSGVVTRTRTNANSMNSGSGTAASANNAAGANVNDSVKQEPHSAGNSNRSTPQPGGGAIKTEIKEEQDDK